MKNQTKSPIFRILTYLRFHYGLFVITLIFSLLIAGSTQLLPQLQRLAIDNYIQPENSTNVGLNADERLRGLIYLGVIYLILIIFSVFVTHFFNYLASKLSESILYRIRNELFAKLQRLPLSFFDKNSVGALMSRINYDVDGIKSFVSNSLLSFILSVITAIVIIISMMSINWQLTLFSLAIIAAMSVFSWISHRKFHFTLIDYNNNRALMSAFVNENITGMTTVQIFNQEERAKVKFRSLNEVIFMTLVKLSAIYTGMQTFIVMMGIISAVILWYIGGKVVQELATLGSLIAFLTYSRSLFELRFIWFDFFNNLHIARGSAASIFALLDEKEIVDNQNIQSIKNFRGEIEFKNVWFSYKTESKINDDDWVLRDVTFRVRHGESVAIVGATGAGKSSIISLIPRLYNIQKGQILIDGIDIEKYKQNDLRKHISVVLQDVILFNDTIENNLTLGNKNISIEKVIEICQLVGIHSFIHSLSDAYRTIVKERGVNFSTGQKQLLAFARALLYNPNGLLILDEATANIDSESEEKIQNAISNLTKNRTSIIIAHRLSTIQHCDRIIVMKNGQIIEEGSHEQLLNQNGYYSTLYESQFQEGIQPQIA